MLIANRDNRGAHAGQDVQPVFHLLQRDGLGKIVKFVAVGASQVAPPVGNNVYQDGVLGRNQGFADHAQFAQARTQEPQAPAGAYGSGRLH